MYNKPKTTSLMNNPKPKTQYNSEGVGTIAVTWLVLVYWVYAIIFNK